MFYIENNHMKNIGLILAGVICKFMPLLYTSRMLDVRHERVGELFSMLSQPKLAFLNQIKVKLPQLKQGDPYLQIFTINSLH